MASIFRQKYTTKDKDTKAEKVKNQWVVGCNSLLLAVLFLAPVAMTSCKDRSENIVKANAFILVDENGKTRAKLSILKDGPAFDLCDKTSKVRARLSVSEDGLRFGLFGQNGVSLACLKVDTNGSALVLNDNNSEASAGLGVGKEGPALWLLNENGNVVWKTPPWNQ